MSDLIDSEKCRRNLECGVCSALISENPENARTRSHSFPEFSYIEDCVENKIQFTRKIPHGVTTKSMFLQAFFNKRYFATLTYVFYLRYSSNWNPHRLHSEPFPPKKKTQRRTLRFDDDHHHTCISFAQVRIFGGKK
jgi:hypothetical protein